MRILLLSVFLLLAGCGWHVRGHGIEERQFAFHSIYIQAPSQSDFVVALRRELKRFGITVLDQPGKQDLTLHISYEHQRKEITALNASGQVIEYMLHYRVSLRVYDRHLNDWVPASEIWLQRILPYDNSLVLAKAQEEAMLYRDMETDAAEQVIRRLAYARPPAAASVPAAASAPVAASAPAAASEVQ